MYVDLDSEWHLELNSYLIIFLLYSLHVFQAIGLVPIAYVK